MRVGDKVVTKLGTGFITAISAERWDLVKVAIDRPNVRLCERIEFFTSKEVWVVED